MMATKDIKVSIKNTNTSCASEYVQGLKGGQLRDIDNSALPHLVWECLERLDVAIVNHRSLSALFYTFSRIHPAPVGLHTLVHWTHTCRFPNLSLLSTLRLEKLSSKSLNGTS